MSSIMESKEMRNSAPKDKNNLFWISIHLDLNIFRFELSGGFDV